MRLLIQRVKDTKLFIDGEVHASINNGLLVYVAFKEGDNESLCDKALSRVKRLRIFEDEDGKINKSLSDINGEVLLVSSFSLYADLESGARPSFSKSLSYNLALPLFDYLKKIFKEELNAKCGVFGADMNIISTNCGPISLILDL